MGRFCVQVFVFVGFCVSWGGVARRGASARDARQTDTAPWTLVPAESKPIARLKVLETIVARLEERFGPLELPDVPRKKKKKR